MAQKWEFNSVYLRNKKKRISFRLTGRRSASRPTAEAGLARVPACRAPRQPRAVPLLAARTRADRGRARPPRGGHAPSTPPRVAAGLHLRPRAHLHLPTTMRSSALHPARSLALPCPPLLAAATERHRHPPVQFTASPPPRPAIVRQQLRLALRHVVLALVPTVEPR